MIIRLFLFFLPLILKADVFVRWPGPLGNSLFKVAAAVALAQENNSAISIEISTHPNPVVQNYYRFILDRVSDALKILPSSAKHQSIYNDTPLYTPIPYCDGMRLEGGYFLSEKYFSNHKDLIRNIFAITPEIETYLQDRFPQILSHSKTVGIHVRTCFHDWKGEKDYFRPFFFQSWLAPDLEFYKKAIELFDADSLFVVCSDYPSWAKKNFQDIPRNFIFIESQEFIYDFFLLTKCRDLIISGSTMGWWAGYLMENLNAKVVHRNPFYAWQHHNTVSRNLKKGDWIAIDMPEIPPPVPVFDY